MGREIGLGREMDLGGRLVRGGRWGWEREMGLGWETELERNFLQAGCPSLSAHRLTHRNTDTQK